MENKFVSVNGELGVIIDKNEDFADVWFGNIEEDFVEDIGSPEIWQISLEDLKPQSETEKYNFYLKLENLFEKAKEITEEDIKHKTIFELLASASEELGEVAKAIKIEEKTFGNAHKTIDESSTSECVDLIICGLSLFYARGGTNKEFREIFNKKLNKWQNNQKK